MTRSDLAEFQSEWVDPISTSYHGYDVFELPPPGQGFAALQMLNILEVCVPKLGQSLAKLGPVESDVLALDGRSQEAGVLGSLRVQRRPEIRVSACGPFVVEIVRGDAVRQDRSRTRRRSRVSAAGSTAERSISRQPIAGATWSR